MKIGPKYKIARRLGAPIFEKTQTQKFASSKKKARISRGGRPGSKTDFGRQLIEKQKARFTYGITERQFSKYVKNIINKKVLNANDALYKILESRLDNVAYRTGLASTRSFGRQMVSHGHILVNGVKVTVPSYSVSKGDILTIRGGSLTKVPFVTLEEKLKGVETPAWIARNEKDKSWIVNGEPKVEGESLLFDLSSVFEYYRR